VYVASGDGKLYCVHRATGKVRWQYFAGGPLTAAPVVAGENVYQFVPRTGLAALSHTEPDPSGKGPPELAYNRRPKWIVPGAVQFLAEDEGHAYLRSTDDHILAVDKKTGEQKFRSNRAFKVFGTNTKDAVIFAATADGHVLAIRPVLKAGEVGEIVMLENDVNNADAG
jgi:outer membrane protein assembly factor BamB